MRKLFLFGIGLLTLASGAASHAQRVLAPHSASAADARSPWQESFDAFAEADRAHPPQPGGVVFVGSSSIRLWTDLESIFAAVPVINRGFGGSRLFDCAENLQRLVLPYKPRLVVVYAGDNDMAEGRSPEQVLASFQRFVEGVHRALPDTRIAYLSIKPSPARAALLTRVKAANALIEQYARDLPGLDYIDVYSAMVDPEGRPRSEFFGEDGLHMNRHGYALWRGIIAEHLRPPGEPAAMAKAR